MFVTSHRARHQTPARRRPRRGVALVFVMVFVIAMAALAMSSIFMSSGATNLARSYDRERDLRFAAEAALAIGKARINGRPSLLLMPPDTIYRSILKGSTILGADSLPLPGILVDVYVGLTGSTSGQYGRFASVVAYAYDVRTHAGFIRRLELAQESFAKYAYWSNRENSGTGPIFFGNRDVLWGPVWSNDTIRINSDSAFFRDQVGTARIIVGENYGVFAKPPQDSQPVINLPSLTQLNVLVGYANQGGMTINSMQSASANSANLRDRIEFVAFDVDGNKDSTGADEGFYRWFQAGSGYDQNLRGDWPGTTDADGNPGGSNAIPNPSAVERCGDWHYSPRATGESGPVRLKFYPASVHRQAWFRNHILAGQQQRGDTPAGYTSIPNWADAEAALGNNGNLPALLSHPGSRCYLAGDPHLVATERVVGWARGLPLGGTYTDADVQKGGEDTTFTPVSRYGKWMPPDSLPHATIRALRPWDGRYLRALGHSFAPWGQGVIYATGNVGISGLVNGAVTLYAAGDIVLLDDLAYANSPALDVCRDMLGLISNYEVVIADNALNTPVGLSTSGPGYGYRNMDDNAELTLHAVVMALNNSFRAENYNLGPTDVNDCGAAQNGRGCIALAGGIIQQVRGTVGKAAGQGFAKSYSYDHCVLRTPPPYFPTTGRFQDNRYLELDPVGFDPKAYFLSLSPARP